jgi:oligopeptide/dipeptide ABC transporter ATP-binding protein
MTAFLECRHVTKIFGGGLFNRSQNTALEDLSLDIKSEPPSITAIVGESGSGKTTLARLLLGLITPTRGEVLYQGKELRALSGDEQRHFLRDVQVIFQDPYEVYNPFYRVDHVLETPIRKFGLARGRDAEHRLMEDTLRAVGLRPDETLGRHPHQLSGGQRQRVMVARALLLKPKLIIADEPVSMVDASLRATILATLRALNRDFGISLIYITHDLTTAYQIGENIIVLYRGSVAEVGDVELVVKQPRHPYTQLLVGSIPLPNPAYAWRAEEPRAGIPGAGDATACKFAGRCPHAMPMCVETPPPLFRSEPHRAASCYLYRGAPVLDARDMDEVFVQPGCRPDLKEDWEIGEIGYSGHA